MGITVLLIALGFLSPGPDIDPVREYSMTPESFGLMYEGHIILTSDGAEIKTWHMPSPSDDRRNITVLIAGSDAGNMGFTLPYAFHLLRAGFDVVTFDYRGFGGSSDFTHNRHYLYHPEYIIDFNAVCAWVSKDFKPEKVGVLAFSMGTLIATAGYPICTYDFLIAEGFITSPDEVVHRINTQKDKHLMLPADYSPDLPNQIARMDIPMLVFASQQDSVTTLPDSKNVTDGRHNRTLIPYDGPHLRGMATLGTENYIGHITAMANQL